MGRRLNGVTHSRACWSGGLLVALIAALLLAPSPAQAQYKPGGDWVHFAQVVGRLSVRTPARPMVYLLGGSAARECTVSDRSWRTAILKAGGPDTLAYNLGTTGQTYDDDVKLIAKLPQVPTIVIIGVNVGRYTRNGSRPLPQVKPVLTRYYQHRFTVSHILTDARKQAALTDWLTRRYPVFQDRFAHSAEQLSILIDRCVERGFHPVMLNLPLNLKVIGHRMDKPRRRYRISSQAIGADHQVPWVNWLSTIRLVSRDFADNWHLVEPGRVKWQSRLTSLTVTLLKRYDMN